MTDINNSTDGSNQNETNNSKKGNKIYKNKIFRDYIDNRINLRPDFFNDGLDYNDFLDFIRTSIYKSNYDNFENNKDTYLNYFVREITVYNTKYKNIFDNVFASFENDFVLDTEIQTILKDRLSSQDNNSLKKLLYSSKKRADFLKHHLGIKNIIFKEDQERIEKILPKTFSEIKDNKEAISSIFSFIDRRTKVELDDLENILNILKTSKQKIEFISFFIPSISLEEAFKIGFLSKNDIEKRKEDIIRKYAGKNCDDECIKDISKTIDNKDIYIDTFELDRDKDISITPAILQNITDQINEGKEQLSNEAKIIDTYEVDEFIHFIKKDTSLSQVLYNFQNIKNGNFFKIVIGEGSGSILQYFRFDEVKSGKETSSMEFTNITLNTGVNTKLYDSARKETKTYFAMYEMFQKLKSKNGYIVFMNKFDLEKDLQKEGKIEVPYEGNINSKEDLKKFFDEVDPKGKELGVDNIAFKFDIIGDDKKKKGEELYIIEEIDEKTKTITLHSGEKLGFDRFAELFKLAKAKRIQKISTPKEFIEKLSLKNENFKDIIFKDNKIIPKDKENDSKYKSIQYFIGEKGEESIFIKNMGDNRVDFVIGKYNEGVSKDGKVGKDTFKGEKKGTGWTYTEFFDMIKDKKLSPKIFDNKTNNQEEKVKNISGQRGHIFSAWIGGFVSINSIVDGFKGVIDTIEKRLEQGDKLKSQMVTMAFAKFLPKSLQDEIQSRVEKEEKSTMEEIRDVLTNLDSTVMIPRIEKILLDTNSPSYEREARMFACLKYGTIYPKTLSKYRGTYAWFKAMGGNVKNIPYYKKEILKDDPNLVITEEDLIAYLFKLQANGDHPPKRRSKIHKEFIKAIGGGISDEMGNGELEAGKKMTQQGRINYVMGEINNGTYYNGIGGIEKIWLKGPDPAYKMFEVPFVLLSTKTTLNLNQEIINKLVGYAFSTAHTPLVFAKSESDLEMYKDYIKRVIELRFGKESSILKDFKSIGSNTRSAQSFWDKYGEDLYPYINMNNSFVLSRKDEPGNEILKTYYEKIKGVHSSDDFKNGKLNDDIEGGVFDFENSPIFATKGLLEKVSAKDRGYIDKKTAKILNTYTDYINSLRNDETVLNEEKRKELFKEYYRLVERVVYGKISPHKNINSPEGWYKNFEIAKALETKGVEIYDGPEGRGYDDFLDKKYNDFMRGTHIQDDIDLVTNETYKKIDDILN